MCFKYGRLRPNVKTLNAVQGRKFCPSTQEVKELWLVSWCSVPSEVTYAWNVEREGENVTHFNWIELEA
jgi:hypothetical protein